MLTVSGLVRRLSPVRSVSVTGWGTWERKSALPLAEPFRVLHRVYERREKLQPAPDAGIVLAYLGDVLDRLIVRACAELGRLKVTA